jgi:hypothetical protein
VANETKGDIVYAKTMALVANSLKQAYAEYEDGNKALAKGKKGEAQRQFTASCEMLHNTAKICAGFCQVLNSSRFVHPLAMVYHIMACESLQMHFDTRTPDRFPKLGDFDPVALGETLSSQGKVDKDAWGRVLGMMLKPGGCCNVQIHVSKALAEMVKHSASLLQKDRADEDIDLVKTEFLEIGVIWDTLNLDLQAYFALTDAASRALADFEAGYPKKPVKILKKSTSTTGSNL